VRTRSYVACSPRMNTAELEAATRRRRARRHESEGIDGINVSLWPSADKPALSAFGRAADAPRTDMIGIRAVDVGFLGKGDYALQPLCRESGHRGTYAACLKDRRTAALHQTRDIVRVTRSAKSNSAGIDFKYC
jgi:hypothetical protein